MRAGKTLSSSTLVTLREGDRRPLFIAHSLSGTMLELWALARELDCHCAVIGIQGRGLSRGRSAEFSTWRIWPRITSCNSARFSPMDHTLLQGFLMGGTRSAFECTTVVACGETVELLALLDTQLDEQCLMFQDWLFTRRRRAAHEPARSALVAGASASLIHVKAGHFADRLRGYRWKNSKARQRRRAKAPRCAQSIAAPTEDHSALRVAMAAYRRKTYSGKVTFFMQPSPIRAGRIHFGYGGVYVVNWRWSKFQRVTAI